MNSINLLHNDGDGTGWFYRFTIVWLRITRTRYCICVNERDVQKIHHGEIF